MKLIKSISNFYYLNNILILAWIKDSHKEYGAMVYSA